METEMLSIPMRGYEALSRPDLGQVVYGYLSP